MVVPLVTDRESEIVRYPAILTLSIGVLTLALHPSLAADQSTGFVQQFHNACTASVAANSDAAARLSDEQIASICACSSARADDVVTDRDRSYFETNQALPDDFATRVQPVVAQCVAQSGGMAAP